MSDLVERLDVLESALAYTDLDSASLIGEAKTTIEELEAERDEWKAKFEWAANKLKEIAEQEKGNE